MPGGLSSGMNACVSGLRGTSQSVNNHTQNIATAGAIAGKRRQAFLSAVNIGTSPNDFTPGGVMATHRQFISEVGSQISSSVSTHMALGGSGFFITTNNSAGIASGGRVGFTRVGSFEPDKDGRFRNSSGQYLMVFPTDSSGTPIATDLNSTSQMQVATTEGLTGRTIPTSTAFISGSLDSQAGQPGHSNTYDTSLKVYDSLGVERTVKLNFTQLDPTTPLVWTVTASAADEDPMATIDPPYDGTMTITFDEYGNPLDIGGYSTLGDNTAPPLTVTWSTGAAPSTITMDFGKIGESNGLTIKGESYEVNKTITNGQPPSKYLSTEITEDGILYAKYDSGEKLAYARIPVALFANENELLEKTGGVYYTTAASGDYSVFFPKQGKAPEVLANNLEESKIDTAEEFTALIVDQQRFTANLKGISTIDEMLKSLSRSLGG